MSGRSKKARSSGRGEGLDGREQRGERTAEALLTSARRAFAARGYAGASVRAIARDAGANPALVRYHFGSKEGLYHEVIDQAMGRLRDRLLEAFQAEGDFEARATRVIGSYLDHLVSERDFPRLMARAILDGDAALLRVARRHLRPLLDSVRPLAKDLDERELGRFDDVILTLFGATLVPVLYAPMLEAIYLEDPMSERAVERRRHHLERLTRLLVGKMVGPPAQ